MRAIARRPRSTRRATGERFSHGGFALVFVIWGLGIIALITSSLVLVERYRAMAVRNVVANAEAASFAESAAILGRLTAARSVDQGLPAPADSIKTPFVCAFEGAAVAIQVDDESGKVDINAASPKLLATLLRGFGARPEEAERATAAIVAFRAPPTSSIASDEADRPYTEAGREYRPKKAPFETIFELDQVLGLRPALVDAILPYVTVASHKPDIDPHVASGRLLVALSTRGSAADDPPPSDPASAVRGVPAEFLGTSTRRSLLVHAEALTDRGGMAARDAVIELTGSTPPDALKEIRRADNRHAALLKASRAAGLSSCYDRDDRGAQ